jgi:DNA-binding LacI/PurR family transcriptional regulator
MTKVTIDDIARRAGVSKTAVSFAFNNPSRLSEATVKNILAIAEELGYIPNPVARSMNTGRTGTIGVLVPQPIPEIIRNPFLPEFLEGVGEVCTRVNLSLMIVPPVEGSMRRALANAAVDGFLTLGLEEFKSTMMVLRKRGVAYVTVDSDPIEGVPAVNIDDEGGATAAMEHVLKHGHREILILAIRSGKHGKFEQYAGTLRDRIQGYRAALKAQGLDLDGRKVRLMECSSTEKGGRAVFRRVLRSKWRPTAVVAMSDIIAIGVMREAIEAGLRVPGDLSIVGFDDLPLSTWVNPPLTTVAQPLCKKGRLAAEILLKTIEGQSDPRHHVLPTKLVARKSVAFPSDRQDNKPDPSAG